MSATTGHRRIEIAAIVACGALVVWTGARLAAAAHPGRWWLLAAAAVAGYVAADFVSGVTHWLFDTWGSERTPIIGRAFVRPFREHHVDPDSICRHDFVETNGNSCIASAPVLAAACLIPVDGGAGLFATGFLSVLSVASVATNQLHKWAHERDPGRAVRILQRSRLILSARHHRLHHQAPNDSHYCITTGWLNPLLETSGFFRRLEWAITALLRAARSRHHRGNPIVTPTAVRKKPYP
jgi:ubiquitin-conjugating enzyme E2 variant